MLILNRLGDPSFNSSIFITDGHNKSWYIDPHQELVEAAGGHFARRGCVASFAAGLHSAGHHSVMIKSPVNGSQLTQSHGYHQGFRRVREVRLEYNVVSEYFFVGLAWAQGDWDNLKETLQSIEPGYRRLRLRLTADHYHWMYQREAGKPKLMIL